MGESIQLELARVLAVDDHPTVLESVRLLIAPDLTLRFAGCAQDGCDAIAQTLVLKPSLILMDANMPRKSGVDATREIRRFDKTVKILFYSADPSVLYSALVAGAQGFVQKGCSTEILLMAMHSVLNGGIYIDQWTWLEFQETLLNTRVLPTTLDEEEMAVSPFLIEGLTSKEIGDRLDIKTRRVEKVRMRMMKKLGAKNAAALTLHLAKLLPPNPPNSK